MRILDIMQQNANLWNLTMGITLSLEVTLCIVISPVLQRGPFQSETKFLLIIDSLWSVSPFWVCCT